MASERARRAAAERLGKIDKEVNKKASKIKRNKLRAEATMGSKKVRKKASTALSNSPRQFKD